MEEIVADKRCLECEVPLKGRADKKFCSDHCRAAYNNKRYGAPADIRRHINHILRRNHAILQALNADHKRKVHHDTLVVRGFNFNYFTSMRIAKSGLHYFYCYELGYTAIDSDHYQLVIREV